MSYNIHQKFALATNQETRPDILALLARDEIPNVRALVGRNINTPTCILAELIGDKIDFVRYSCGENPKLINLDLVRILAKDQRSQEAISRYNPHPHVLEFLFKNSELLDTKILILRNKNCPIKLFLNLKDNVLRQMVVIEDYNTPSWVLRDLMGDYPEAKKHPNFKNIMGAILDRIDYLISSEAQVE